MNRVLIIEDDKAFCGLVEAALRDDGFYVEAAHTLKDGHQMASKETPDVVLLDLSLPDSPNDKTVAAVKAFYNGVIIVLSVGGDETTSRKYIMDSASGVMDKGKGLKYIGTELRHSLKTFSKMTERETAIHSLE